MDAPFRLSSTFHPLLYEVNTRILLTELSAREGKGVTLATIPDDVLDTWASFGFDVIWMMGIWTNGGIGKSIAKSHEGLMEEYRKALPDVTPEDVGGSPYAVAAYSVPRSLGGRTGLAALRKRLRHRGLGLILDFVPNHTARDHPWVMKHPEYYVEGSEDLLREHPDRYFKVRTAAGAKILAYGRDPLFPGWTDTAQIDYRSSVARQAMVEQLLAIAELCDGVRCDMAMLVLNDVFESTWGPCADTEVPSGEFWTEVIDTVRSAYPEFLFIAESYWNREWDLQQLGFDFTYDKTLYDRLLHEGPVSVRQHLQADPLFQRRLLRFIENHDEQRAARSMPAEGWHCASAAIMATVPGMALFHDGQLEGRRVKVPVQLVRRPAEEPNTSVREFYSRLLGLLRDEVFREGEWRMLPVRPAWHDNPTWQNFFTHWWHKPGRGARLVVVNFGPQSGQCYVDIPVEGCHATEIEFRDMLGDAVYVRDKAGLAARGMYFDLTGYGIHVFEANPCHRRGDIDQTRGWKA